MFDGPWERNTALQATFEQEITALAAPRFTVAFPAAARRVADWTLDGARAAVEALLADPDVDLVLTVGPVGSSHAMLPSSVERARGGVVSQSIRSATETIVSEAGRMPPHLRAAASAAVIRLPAWVRSRRSRSAAAARSRSRSTPALPEGSGRRAGFDGRSLPSSLPDSLPRPPDDPLHQAGRRRTRGLLGDERPDVRAVQQADPGLSRHTGRWRWSCRRRRPFLSTSLRKRQGNAPSVSRAS